VGVLLPVKNGVKINPIIPNKDKYYKKTPISGLIESDIYTKEKCSTPF
jgi:hypothetical protein